MYVAEDAAALRYLLALVVGQGGYERCGVRGWALHKNVERGTGVALAERLPYLVAHGYLDRADVRPPTMTRPTWIYRINAAGAARVPGNRHEIPPLGQPGPGDRAVYIPPRSAEALAALCAAFSSTGGPEHIAGERGWRTMRDLHRLGQPDESGGTGYEPPAVGKDPWEGRDKGWEGPDAKEPWSPDGWASPEAELARPGWDPLHGEMASNEEPLTAFATADVAWLVKVGLAQRWVLHRKARGRLILYRVTPAGLAVFPLVWIDLPAHGR